MDPAEYLNVLKDWPKTQYSVRLIKALVDACAKEAKQAGYSGRPTDVLTYVMVEFLKQQQKKPTGQQ